jgi:hypothetical protein
MALTNSRWIALALLGFVLAPVLVFRPADERRYRPTTRDQLQARAGRAVARARDAAERLRIMQLADSLKATMSGAPANTHRVMFDHSLDTTTRRLLADLAHDATRNRSTQPRVATDIAFVVDTLRTFGGSTRRGFGGAMATVYLLPQPSTAGRCVAIVRVRPWGVNEFRSEASRERLLGPCAFYEAFGPPGGAVERWLNNGAWSLAQTNWQLGWSSWSDSWHERKKYPLRYALGSRGVLCAAGNDSVCTAALENSTVRFARLRNGLLAVDHNPYMNANPWFTRNWDFGMRSPALVGDMVSDLGAEKFARFWQSDLEPEAAFQAATGTPLPQWTRTWLHRTYHEEKTGAGLSGVSLAWGAAILALALAVILRTAERRQMA